MIKLKALALKNFGSYECISVDFTNLSDSRLYLIYGKNGSGKSTLIVDSLEVGLYGKSSRYDVLKDCISKKADASEISIHLEVKDVKVNITRVISQSDHLLQIFSNGHDVDFNSLAEGQKYLDNLLKTPFEMFKSLIILHSIPLVLDKSSYFQKSLFETMLGLTHLSRASALTEVLLEEVKQKQSDLGRKEKEAAAEKEAVYSQIEKLNKAGEKKAALDKILLEINTCKEALRAEEQLLEERINTYNQTLILRKTLADQEEEAQDILKREELDGEDTRRNQERLIHALGVLEESGECPVCDTKFSGESLQDLMRTLQYKIETKNKMLDKHTETEAASQMTADRLYADLSAANFKLRQDYNATISTQEKIKDLNQTLQRLNFYLARESAEEESNTLLEDSESCMLKLENCDAELKELAEQKKKLQEDLDALAVCLDAFSEEEGEIKSLIISSYLLQCSERADQILQKVTKGSLSCWISPREEQKVKKGRQNKPSLYAVRQGKDVIPYAELSTGEKTVVITALLFALHELLWDKKGIHWNILILDDILESLDDEYLEGAVSFLKEKEAVLDLILVTSHREQMKDYFSHRLDISLNAEGYSKVEKFNL